MGLIPDPNEAEEDGSTTAPNRSAALHESYGVPWFDGMVDGTRLGKLRRSQGIQRSQDGKIKIEWEIVEYSDDGHHKGRGNSIEDADTEMGSSTPGKRKLEDPDEADNERPHAH